VIEQAGGAAITGTSKVLDVPLQSIHQRVPFAAGSRDDVAMLERLTRDDR
jgi:fructose-1,6-bisphosphatase